MARLAHAAIFVGGKAESFSGAKPGIRDEFERFRAHHPEGPVYLVGSAGGETARLIEDTGGSDWERNGLQGEARHVLHASRDPHLVAALICPRPTAAVARSWRLSVAPVRPLFRAPEFGRALWFLAVSVRMPCLPIAQAAAKLGPTS